MDTPYYYRQDSHLYRLAAAPHYCWYTGRKRRQQLLLGVADDKFVKVAFDENGAVLQFDSTILTKTQIPDWIETPTGPGLAYQQLVDLGLECSDIDIRRFWIPDLRIGIEDLFDTGKDLRLNRASFTEEEFQDTLDSIEIWESLDQFVFWWHSDFYIGPAGQVESS